MSLSALPVGIEPSRSWEDGVEDPFRRLLTRGVADIGVGDRFVVLTWLHQGDRDVLEVYPQGDPSRPLTGVFSTRSPDRPNSIGIHRVQVTGLDGNRIRVDALEAIDGTPILDVKPDLD